MNSFFITDPDLKHINNSLKKKIKEFNSLKYKKTSDYTFFIIELQSLKDDLEYYIEVKDTDKDLFEEKREEIVELINKYQKEQFNSCMNRADELLDRIKRI